LTGKEPNKITAGKKNQTSLAQRFKRWAVISQLIYQSMDKSIDQSINKRNIGCLAYTKSGQCGNTKVKSMGWHLLLQ